jgi:DNA polymerase-3 subunit delta
VESIKGSDELKILTRYLENPAEDASLFLLSTGVQQVSSKIQKLIDPKKKVIFWELFENQKRGWVNKYFKNKNIMIRPEALELLLEMVENNTKDLRSVCNRFSLFFGSGSTITVEDIEKYIYHSKEENVFTLFERIAVRDFTASIEILDKILQSGETEGIALVNGLLWQFRKLFSFKNLSEKNFQREELFRNLQIRSKKNQKIYSSADKNFTKKEIVDIIKLTIECDIQLRSYRTEMHGLLLQLLLYYAVKKGGSRIDVEKIAFLK